MVRFFHIRHNNASKGGATVRVEPYHAADGEHPMVRVSVAMCSPNDQFCRATGRYHASVAATDKYQLMPLKGLPGKLHRVACSVLHRTKGAGPRSETELFQRDFGFATKYFTEKKEAITAE